MLLTWRELLTLNFQDLRLTTMVSMKVEQRQTVDIRSNYPSMEEIKKLMRSQLAQAGSGIAALIPEPL